jgi:3-methyladenine DNA glycosylase AlkD
VEAKGNLKTGEARDLGKVLSESITAGRPSEAYQRLAPILQEKTPFRLLDVIGAEIALGDSESVNVFLEQIARNRTMGGWVVIASALRQQLADDLPGAFERCRRYVVSADVWYATDILGERVPGPALVSEPDRALAQLAPWREDENRWVRRTTGVAVHFWAKRSRGAAHLAQVASTLLDFLEPMFVERDTDAVKGVGWGLKTLGKHYPDLTAEWLATQVRRPHRALMIRKATTYLSPETRARIKEMDE